MNTPEHPPQPLPTPARLGRRWHRRKAVALILVISFIVLLSALVVSFFSRVTSDLATSRAYAEGVTVRQLADSAVGVVMGQIREATTLKNACWGSQPGMIRTYRTAAGLPGSNAYAFYKLYSSHDLIVMGREIAGFDPSQFDQSQSTAAVEVPLGTGGWDKQAAFFTDINEPVEIPDPSAGPNSKTTIKRYPIFDPSVAAIYNRNSRPAKPAWKVEGCEIELNASDRTGNDAPMPVRWVYILRDGTLTAPTPLTGPATGTAGLLASWSTVGSDKSKTGVPTKDNPIVGRIAFWTDDDSCKVNINTAGGFLLPDGVTDEDDATWQNNPNLYKNPSKKKVEASPGFYAGSFWDTPRIQTYFDQGTNSANAADYRGGLANSQPSQNEFQRYPGHPSTTSLGLVFKNLLPAKTGLTSEKLYAMTPRLQPGGSKNGTVYLDTKFDDPLDIKTSYPPVPSKKNPNPDSYHLFASVDEFYYSSDNTSTNNLRVSAETGINQWASKNGETALQKNTITPQLVDQTRFFLTANSRSPELNLVGRPRVAMWPVPTAKREQQLQGKEIRNASDDLIRFCATVGRDPSAIKQATTRQGEFIFDREDPYSPTIDFFLPRNQKIFSYLRDITSSTKGQIPGFGGSFETKYAGGVGGRDQILTEMFDYIRTVNQKDGSREKTIDEKAGPAGSATNNQLKAAARYAPHALVVPTRTTIDGKKVSGFGRYPTISEASIVFYHGGYICVPKAKSDLEKYAQGTLAEIKGLTDKGGVSKIPGSSELVIYDLNIVFPDASPKNTRQPSAFHPDPFFKDADWVKANVEKWNGQLVRAFMIFETFNPMQGYAPVDNFSNISLVNTTKIGADNKFVRYNYADPNKGYYVHELEIESNFSITTSTGTAKLTIGEGVAGGGKLKHTFTRTSGETWDGRNFGGTEGFFHTLQDSVAINAGASNYYQFQTPCSSPTSGARVAFTNTASDDTTFEFSGGKMNLYIRYEDNDKVNHGAQLQKVTLDFPKPSGKWPLPIGKFRNDGTNNNDLGGFDARMANFDADVSSAGAGRTASQRNWDTYLKDKKGLPSGWAMAYHLPSRIAWASEYPHNPMGPKDSQGNVWGDGNHYTNGFLQILQPGDTIRSLVIGGGDPAASDPRIAALQQDVTTFKKHPDYDSPKHRAETLRRAAGGFYFDPSNTLAVYQDPPGTATDGTKSTTGSFIPLNGAKYKPGFGPDLVRTETYNGKAFVAKRSDGGLADFDTGLGIFFDGAFAGKADEGNVAAYWYDEYNKKYNYVVPYFTWVYDNPLDTYFSPNRQVPGPVMFGSLSAPQSDWSKSGWQTLLFCPNYIGIGDATYPSHPGLKTPPDHLLLDLFWMPVVEPYAISEPFSTAGKVNLNYPLVPFGYIKRTTALRAALHPLRVTAIPQNFQDSSKQFKYKGQNNDENLRYLIDRDETLKGFDLFFDKYKTNKNEGFFKSASQICERFLYPKGLLVDGTSSVKATTGEGPIKAFWNQNQLTGDNVREKPYADLYPRITTKSNTYTVHYRVQTLRKRQYTGNAAGEAAYYRTFDERTDKVMSELRGHATIERYLDSEDARFQANYTPAKDKIDVETQSLEDAYRFRIIANKRFSPW